MSFFISDHQIILFSAEIFVEHGRPKCSTSTACFFCSFGITIFSPANSKHNRSVISLKTGENLSEALSFCSFAFETRLSSNFHRLRRFPFSVFQSHVCFECSVSSFRRYHILLGQRWGIFTENFSTWLSSVFDTFLCCSLFCSVLKLTLVSLNSK